MSFFKQKHNRVDVMVEALERDGRVEALEAELGKFNPRDLSEEEKVSWFQLWGALAFRKGKREEAFKWYTAGVESCPKSAELRFALGQELEYRGKALQMFQCFDEARYPQIHSMCALAAARYAYLWGKPEKGLAYLQPILERYLELGNVKDEFLEQQGLPYFGVTWSYIACFYSLLGRLAQLQPITEEMTSRLTNYDFSQQVEFLSCAMKHDFNPYIWRLEGNIREWSRRGYPCGFPFLQRAMLQNRVESNPALSEQRLQEISISDSDFPWLEDVKLLGLCQVEQKRKNLGKEALFKNAFLSRQTLLLEPNWAFDFQFIEYQEALKEKYQERRKDPAAATAFHQAQP